MMKNKNRLWYLSFNTAIIKKYSNKVLTIYLPYRCEGSVINNFTKYTTYESSYFFIYDSLTNIRLLKGFKFDCKLFKESELKEVIKILLKENITRIIDINKCHKYNLRSGVTLN